MQRLQRGLANPVVRSALRSLYRCTANDPKPSTRPMSSVPPSTPPRSPAVRVQSNHSHEAELGLKGLERPLLTKAPQHEELAVTGPPSAPNAISTLVKVGHSERVAAGSSIHAAHCVAIRGLADSHGEQLSLPEPGETAAYDSQPGVRFEHAPDYTRNFFDVTAVPVDRHCFAIDVASHHKRPAPDRGAPSESEGGAVELLLQARAIDGDVETFPTLCTLMPQAFLNEPGTFEGKRRFYVSYDAIDAYLKQLNPNLGLKKGVQLAVLGRWDSFEEWGGFGLRGEFDVPVRLEGTTSADVRCKRAADRAKFVSTSHVLPSSVVAAWSDVLPEHGTVSSKIGTTLRGTAPARDVEETIALLHDLAELQAPSHMLGGLRVEAETPRFGAEPFADSYLGKDLLAAGVVVRRSAGVESDTIVVEPAPGRADEARRSARTHLQLEVPVQKSASSERVGDFLRSGSSYNPAMRELQAAGVLPQFDDEPLDLSRALDIAGERQRFTIKDGDKVVMRVTASVFKAEAATGSRAQLADVQIELVQGEQRVPEAPTAVPTTLLPLESEDAQREWGRNASPQVTLVVPPHFCRSSDVKQGPTASQTDRLMHLMQNIAPRATAATLDRGHATAIALGACPAAD